METKPETTDERSEPIPPAATPPEAPTAESAVSRDWGYPAFAKDFPRHPELDELVAAFSRGDFQAVRERAPKLAASSEDDAVKRAAQTLRERVEPDPTSKLLFLFAAALLAFLTGWWITHDGAEGSSPKPTPAAKHAE
jgi:hypothetical protein